MTTRKSRFFGGTLDGQTHDRAPARRLIRLAIHGGRHITETYVRDGHSGTPDDPVLHYRLESSEDATEQMAKADRENREQTMALVLEALGG